MSQVPQAGLNSLATIIKRLEAATSRLEDLAAHSAAPSSQQQHSVSSPAADAPPPAPSTPVTVKAFEDNVMKGTLEPFVQFNKSLTAESDGTVLIEQVAIIQQLFSH
ncbi:hypothetical protein M422DRAFT_259804, partial [Sphaerobolus stellatus SS14]